MPKTHYITSVINHNIRVLLGLSCDEYAAMEVLHELYCEQPITPCARINNRLGLPPEQCQQILRSLQEKRMLYLSDDFMITYIIDDRWLAQFNVDADFLEFWKIFREYGNRVAAQKNYNQVRKSVDKETLHAAAAAYITWCDQNNSDTKFNLKAQTWLDPKARRWEDKLSGVLPEGAPTEKKFSYL